jgi:DNA-binding LacI/PurR family transcriptional regulator
MRVTIIDVAKAAGVSRTTVSNVLGGKGKYSDETRDAVLAATKKLGYKPNLAARSLITNRSRLIGLILPSYVDTNTLTNSPFYNVIMDSVYSVLRLETYFDLIIFSVPYKEILFQINDRIDARNVDGILAVGEYEHSFLQDLNAKDLPVVLIDNYSHGNFINFSYVNSDDERGGYLATQHLIEKGYEKIALCSLDLDGPLMQKRYLGYKLAMKEAGYKEHVLDRVGIPFEAGLQFADSLAAQELDAAFCTEDMIAAGLVHGMLKRGVKIGSKFGVVGFDNFNIGRQISPELTTIDQNSFMKGETAAKTLLKIINSQAQRGSRLILPVSLVERETA